MEIINRKGGAEKVRLKRTFCSVVGIVYKVLYSLNLYVPAYYVICVKLINFFLTLFVKQVNCERYIQ